MTQAFYSAKLGIIAQQRRTDLIANNIANVNTSGFKESRMDFKDTLYKTMINPAEPAGNANLICGSGILTGAASRSFAQGALTNTGHAMDLSIKGDGFFAVLGKDGTQKYTRNGCFSASRENDGVYLVTAQGEYVLDTDNNRIKLSEAGFTVTESGEIMIEDSIAAKLKIVTFVNKDGLMATGGSSFVQTEASGPPVESSAVVKQGYIEGSNVDLVGQLTQVMRSNRAFSVVSRVLSVANEMDAAVNNLRG